jgi:hypothetical protein
VTGLFLERKPFLGLEDISLVVSDIILLLTSALRPDESAVDKHYLSPLSVGDFVLLWVLDVFFEVLLFVLYLSSSFFDMKLATSEFYFAIASRF